MAYPATQTAHNISLVVLRITILFLFINNYFAKRILPILTSTSLHRASERTFSLELKENYEMTKFFYPADLACDRTDG